MRKFNCECLVTVSVQALQAGPEGAPEGNQPDMATILSLHTGGVHTARYAYPVHSSIIRKSKISKQGLLRANMHSFRLYALPDLLETEGECPCALLFYQGNRVSRRSDRVIVINNQTTTTILGFWGGCEKP